MNKMIAGACLIAAGAGIIGWNETRTAATQDAIAEMAAATVELRAVSPVNAAFDGKTVHASGMVTLSEPFVDPDFGVSANAVSLTRNVQFYLWREKSESRTRKGVDGKDEHYTTYSYDRSWGPDYVDSSTFHEASARNSRANRKLLEKPREATVYSSRAMLGAYALPASMLKSMSGAKQSALSMDENAKIRMASLMADTHSGWVRHILGYPLSAATSDVAEYAAQRLIHLQGNVLYFGLDPSHPAIGDVRVTYTAVAPSEISLIATVSGSSLKPFVSSKGKTVTAVSSGSKSKEELCGAREQGNRTTAWILRALGALCAACGIGVITRKKAA
ncbi:MAG: TMEM43 family protein [Mailhella sp.]|nr:TMEM43 family protein [Mailhella sp.]